MLTIFTIPKPFTGHNKIIQINAIKSWILLEPKCEIYLFGDDEGVAETAARLNVNHVSFIEKTEFGTPLLSSAFSTAQKLAKNDLLMYVNADIIFFQDVIDAIKKIDKPLFLICGRRWDLDVKEEIDFNESSWSLKLINKIKGEGVLHGLAGMDYFIFKRDSFVMPEFAVGRTGWDSWLIFKMKSMKIPVINATEAINIIHQNHDYSHSKFGGKKRVGGPEWKKNIKIAGGLTNLLTLREADWILNKNGLRKPEFPSILFGILSKFYIWRLLLALKRKIQNFRG